MYQLRPFFLIAILVLFFSFSGFSQLFQQDFNGGAFTPATINCSSGQVTDLTTYRNATAPSNSQFTYINTSTGTGCGTSISVNTTSGKLEVVKIANNAYLARSFAFPSNPTSVLVRFDFEVLSNTSANTGAFNFYIGDTIPDGNSSSSYRFHTNFKIGIGNSGTLGWRVNSTGAEVTGSHTILLAVNNSGSTLNYLAPNGTCESVSDDRYDVWIDSVRYVNEGASSTNAGQTLKRFAIVSSSAPASTSTIDNILIDPISPTPTVLPETPITGPGVGFNANWTPVSGVTGYYLDIADNNTFTTNLNTIYVAGAATSSYTFSSLTLGNTYYYRVRAASQYTIGTYQSCNSATESGFASSALSFSSQPQNISQCLGVSNVLSVSSTQAISYQWYSNTINSNTGGTLIGGATGTTYTPPSAVAGTKYYYCLIGNGTVQIASNVATVRVDQSPTLTGVSQLSAVCGGQNATILLTGLVPSSINKVYYHVGSGGALLADSVLETGGGNGSFLFMTTNANNGQILFIDSIQSSCTSIFSNSVTLNVNTSPSNPTGGSTVTACTVGALTLSVSDPGAGFTTNWYGAATGGSILSGGSGTNSYITPSLSNDTSVTYYAQTFSAITGCSSPTRVAVIGSVTIPVFTLTNTTLYSPVPVSPFSVRLPYSFATSGLNQYSIAWTSANAVTAAFSTVTNASLPVSPISITLNANAIAGQTYTGTITVRNSSTGCATAAIPFTIVVLSIQVGDYGSVANGNWTTTTTWRKYNPITGRFDSTVTAAPNTATNIWIIDGYTVTANLGGSCKTIHVLNGSLISGTNVSLNQNLSVSGTILEVAAGGSIGTSGVDDNADGISFSFNSPNTTTTISGIGGSIDVSKFIIGGPNANVVIDHDITVHFHGIANNGYGAALYSNSAGVNVTLNAGRTLTMAKWASICNTTAPLTNSGSTTLKLNINGTLNFLPGAPIGHSGPQQTFPSNSGFLCLNTTSTRIDTLNIGATGVINCTEFYPNGIVASGATGTGNLSLLSIASGGVFNIDSIADFRNASQIITGAGTFGLRGTALMRIGSTSGITASGATGQVQTSSRSFSTNGRYSYESRNAQVTGDGIPSTIGALIVRDTATTLTLSKSLRVTDSIRFNHGKLVLSTFDINTASVKNYKDTNYVVTNSTGSLKIRNVANSDVVFPVGPSTSAYNPVTLNNIGTPDTFAVKVATGAPTGVAVAPRLDSAINRNWTIVEDVQGGSSVTVTPQWLSSEANAQFLGSYCAVLHSNGTVIDAAGSVGPATGAGTTVSPFTKYGSGFISFLSTDKFGVSTSPKKFRSRDSGPWNDFNSWELYNASGGYSPSEVDFPSVNPFDVVIQNTHTINTVSGTLPIANNLQIDGLLSTLSDDISIYGNWTRSSSGGFDHNNKVVKFLGSANATISASGADEYFPYLTLAKTAVGNTLSISDHVKIGKQLTVTTGTLSLGSKDITLQSNAANGTASFGVMGASGALSYGTGRFVVERYIPTGVSHSKSWQLLAVPTNDGQTINQAWQDTATSANQNRYSGYGTQLTGQGGWSNGFDLATTSPSLKIYEPATDSWTGVANTSLPMFNKKGYMVFVRGDRSVTGYQQSSNVTNLRTRGKLFTSANAPATTTVLADKYETIGNPYASAIDFATLTRTGGIDQSFWVWDPTLNTFGGYVNKTSLDGYGGYKIQSGQAFFVHATGSSGTVSFTESAKVAGSSLFTRIPSLNTGRQFIYMSLYNDINTSKRLIDMSMVAFDNGFSNNYDGLDAKKINNPGENLGITLVDKTLSSEARFKPQHNDTIHLSAKNMKTTSYQLAFRAVNFKGNLIPILVDRFTGVQTSLSGADSIFYNFSITSDLKSAATDRFFIVFTKKKKTLANFEGQQTFNGYFETFNQKSDLYPTIQIAPNPIVNGRLRLVYNNIPKGFYLLRVSTIEGQIVTSKGIDIGTVEGVKEIKISNISKGVYNLDIIAPDGKSTSKQIFIN